MSYSKIISSNQNTNQKKLAKKKKQNKISESSSSSSTKQNPLLINQHQISIKQELSNNQEINTFSTKMIMNNFSNANNIEDNDNITTAIYPFKRANSDTTFTTNNNNGQLKENNNNKKLLEKEKPYVKQDINEDQYMVEMENPEKNTPVPKKINVDVYDVINEDDDESLPDNMFPPNLRENYENMEKLRSQSNKDQNPQIESNKNELNVTHEIYIVRNKDTGETYDLRNETHLAKVTPAVDAKLKLKDTPWHRWWQDFLLRKKLREANEALWDAAESGDANKVAKLLDKKVSEYPAEVNSKLLDDWTALHLASNEGHIEVAKVLLANGANIDAKTTIWRTPLHIACLRGWLHMVKVLIEFNANLNACDKDFCTPLHYASERGFIDILNYLLTQKLDINFKNHAGLTAYDISLNIETRKVFESYGISNDTAISTFGRTSLEEFIIFNSRTDYVDKMLHGLAFKNRRVSTTTPTQKNLPAPIETNSSKPNDINGSKPAMSIEQKKQPETPKKVSSVPSTLKISQIEINPVENGVFLINIYNNPNYQEKIGPQHFLCHAMLGKGSFGEVYLVQRTLTKKLYAMKVLKKDKIFEQNLIRYAKTERNILSIMNHPFIVRLHYAFQTEAKLYLVLEFCPGGDLGKMLARKKKFTEEIARIYACEILLALEALHKNCIVFRDLKPENVVLDSDGHALLTDFGLSKEGVNTNLSRSFCGSVAYLAPEMLARSGHDRSVDWYLFGVLLYEMLTGMPPFFSKNRDELFDNIQRAPLALPKSLSEHAKSLLAGLIKRDRTKRLGAKGDAEEIKAHPWFMDVNWDDVLNRKYTPPLPEIKKYSLTTVTKINDKTTPTKSKKFIDSWSFVTPDEKQT